MNDDDRSDEMSDMSSEQTPAEILEEGFRRGGEAARRGGEVIQDGLRSMIRRIAEAEEARRARELGDTPGP